MFSLKTFLYTKVGRRFCRKKFQLCNTGLFYLNYDPNQGWALDNVLASCQQKHKNMLGLSWQEKNETCIALQW